MASVNRELVFTHTLITNCIVNQADFTSALDKIYGTGNWSTVEKRGETIVTVHVGAPVYLEDRLWEEGLMRRPHPVDAQYGK
jgi:hypothetical protein